MLLATAQDQLKDHGSTKFAAEEAPAQMARVENEIANLRQDFALIEDSYATDHLNLVIVRGHKKSLCKYKRVARYLSLNHRDAFWPASKGRECDVGSRENHRVKPDPHIRSFFLEY